VASAAGTEISLSAALERSIGVRRSSHSSAPEIPEDSDLGTVVNHLIEHV
jgi:hypothetical protein